MKLSTDSIKPALEPNSAESPKDLSFSNWSMFFFRWSFNVFLPISANELTESQPVIDWRPGNKFVKLSPSDLKNLLIEMYIRSFFFFVPILSLRRSLKFLGKLNTEISYKINSKYRHRQYEKVPLTLFPEEKYRISSKFENFVIKCFYNSTNLLNREFCILRWEILHFTTLLLTLSARRRFWKSVFFCNFFLANSKIQTGVKACSFWVMSSFWYHGKLFYTLSKSIHELWLRDGGSVFWLLWDVFCRAWRDQVIVR